MSRGREIQSIDIFRLIMAFLVIAIHFPPFTNVNSNLNFVVEEFIARLAVPFFLVCTGYFFFRDDPKIRDINKLVGKILSLLKMYVFWTVVYSPFVIAEYRKYDIGLFDKILMFLRKSLFVGSYSHLWYLPASIVGLFLTFIIIRLISNRSIQLAVALIIYSLGYLGQFLIGSNSNVGGVLLAYSNVFETTRNGLFFAFPLIYTGYVIACNCRIQDRDRWNSKIDLFGLVLSMLFGITEMLVLLNLNLIDVESTYDIFIFLLPASYFLIISLIRYTSKFKFVDSTWKIRKMANLIYFIHFAIIDVYCFICTRVMEAYPIFALSYVQYSIVALGSVIVSWVSITLLARLKLNKLMKLF